MDPLPRKTLQKQVALVHLPSVLNGLRGGGWIRFRPAPGSSSGERLIQATCIQCGIELTTEELENLAGREGSSATPCPPRLQRLRNGYGARYGCDSALQNALLGHSVRGIPGRSGDQGLGDFPVDR
jgi:hypothetical protein